MSDLGNVRIVGPKVALCADCIAATLSGKAKSVAWRLVALRSTGQEWSTTGSESDCQYAYVAAHIGDAVAILSRSLDS